MRKMLKISFFKTLLFNLHYFKFKGFSFPFIVSKNIKLEKMKGNIQINNRKGHIMLGFGPTQASSYERGSWYNTGNIVFESNAHFYSGIRIYNNGYIYFGNNFIMGASKLNCENEMVYGDNVMISWGCELMDSDFHDIIDKDSLHKINNNGKIIIGDNVWIASHVLVLKNTFLSDNSIVAAGSKLVGVNSNEKNVVVTDGAKILKRNIIWKWDYTKTH